jgi:hypothetical protein
MLAVRVVLMYRLACINDVFHFLQQQKTCEEQTKHTLLLTLRERTEAKGSASLTTQTLGDQMNGPLPARYTVEKLSGDWNESVVRDQKPIFLAFNTRS